MARSRNALLVYPEIPPSYWGFRYALELLGRRSAMPPIGLLTVAAMFPGTWNVRLIDMNVEELADRDLEWADLVLTSTMVVQQGSLAEVIARANALERPIAVGGPHPTSFHDEIPGADFYLLDEVEETFPGFLADWERGSARRFYRPAAKPAVTLTPVPRFDLLHMDRYASMALQFSRGCPFNCEFCDITKLFGRVPRTKSNPQMLAELDRLHELGWRGSVFLVDDNFIGNKKEALRLLPALAGWQRERDYPFDFFTEASVNLASLEPLLDAMVEAGFTMTFLGIESPNPKALLQTRKRQNMARDDEDFLLKAVARIQEKGIEVSGGFILGLDGDGPEVFDAQVDFIQRAGIPMAMVGLLTALRGTDLYERLDREGRLLRESTGNNVEIALNFVPELEPETLLDGYRRVLRRLYDPTLANYFERCWTLLARLGHRPQAKGRVGWAELRALARSLRLQLFSRQGPAYAKFLARTLLIRPRQLELAVRLAIKGLHFERFTAQTLAADDFRRAALADYERIERLAANGAAAPASWRRALQRRAARARRHLRRLHRRLRPEFRRGLAPVRAWVDDAIEQCTREAARLELVRHWAPRLRQWFSGTVWREALDRAGYSPVADGAPAIATVTLAPVLDRGPLRRCLERYFRELGVRVVSVPEQLSQLGQEGLERLLQAQGGGAEALLAYLRQLARRLDAVVVPSESGEAARSIQLLTAGSASAATALPHLVCFRVERSRRRLRATLIELGTRLGGDPRRAEAAFESAFALG